MSPQEKANRDRKVARLVAEVDRNSSLAGLDPHEHAADIAERLAIWSDDEWHTLARATDGHGAKVPGEQTQNDVIATFVRRAAASRSANDNYHPSPIRVGSTPLSSPSVGGAGSTRAGEPASI